MKKGGIFLAFLPLIMAVTVLLCFASPAISGEPLGNIYFYNVDVGTFSVVWEVDEVSVDCNVLVYEDNSLSPTLVSGYKVTPWKGSANPVLAQQRGIMQVVVENLPTESRTYYVQTRSRAQGSATNIDYPAFGSLLSVKTEPSPTDSAPTNGILKLSLHEDSTANLLSDGALVIVNGGGNYPVSSGNYGWPLQSTVNVILNFLRTTGGAWLNWAPPSTPANHPITIIAFGGKVPGNNVGQRVINTTFPQELIGTNTGCISQYITTDLGCYFGVNQVVLFHNQKPNLVLEAADTTDPYNTSIPAFYSSSLPIQVCAYDPEGTAVTFALSGQPSGMYLQTVDANCVRITGTPSRPGIYRNIKLKVTDSNWATAYYTFTVIVTGPPTSPISYPMDLPAGWSMISLPVNPTNPRAGSLFPDATAIFKCTAQHEYELLGTDDDMVVGTGYWIFSPFSGTYSIYGYPVDEWTITNLSAGWSMIGGCTDPATASVEDGRIRGIFGFTNRYVHLGASDNLQPGEGFWINISESSTLYLNTP